MRPSFSFGYIHVQRACGRNIGNVLPTAGRGERKGVPWNQIGRRSCNDRDKLHRMVVSRTARRRSSVLFDFNNGTPDSQGVHDVGKITILKMLSCRAAAAGFFCLTRKEREYLRRKKQSPDQMIGALSFRSLAVTYSRTRRPRTTIGAEQFHFRVRKGIGWFPLAIAARQTGFRNAAMISFVSQIQKVDIDA